MLVDNGGVGGPVNGGRLAFVLIASGTPLVAVESTNAVTDGRWRMVTATYDGSGSASGVHLYIDGNNTPTTTLASAVGGTSILNTAPLTIGNTPDGSASFEGSISGPALFGAALTPAQVVQLAADANAARAILGQFVFGGGWYTAHLLIQWQREPGHIYRKFHRRRWKPPQCPLAERQFQDSHSCSGRFDCARSSQRGINFAAGICIGLFARRRDRLRSVPAECSWTPRSGSRGAPSLPQRNGSVDGLRRYQR